MRSDPVLLIALMGLVTYATRIGLLGAARRAELPPLLRRALAYVPVSLLSALVFPAVLAPSGRLVPPQANPHLWAAFATAAVLLATRRPWLAIVLGLGSLAALRAVLP